MAKKDKSIQHTLDESSDDIYSLCVLVRSPSLDISRRIDDNFMSKSFSVDRQCRVHLPPELFRKADSPSRQIPSTCLPPTHNLETWLAEILSPVSDELCNFCLKDVFQLAGDPVDMNVKHTKM
ncbi:unnamed protein product [Trichobilharzia regenti]|nr:unnamed protein product [Trichobilharzia regenti]